MPVALEAKLKREAASKGFTGKRAARYVYGTLRKTGWTPSTQKKKPKAAKPKKKKSAKKNTARSRKRR